MLKQQLFYFWHQQFSFNIVKSRPGKIVTGTRTRVVILKARFSSKNILRTLFVRLNELIADTKDEEPVFNRIRLATWICIWINASQPEPNASDWSYCFDALCHSLSSIVSVIAPESDVRGDALVGSKFLDCHC